MTLLFISDPSALNCPFTLGYLRTVRLYSGGYLLKICLSSQMRECLYGQFQNRRGGEDQNNICRPYGLLWGKGLPAFMTCLEKRDSSFCEFFSQGKRGVRDQRAEDGGENLLLRLPLEYHFLSSNNIHFPCRLSHQQYVEAFFHAVPWDNIKICISVHTFNFLF